VRVTIALMWLNLCGTSGGEVGDAPAPPHAGPGWAVRLPPSGAEVKVQPDAIIVDASDYSRWWDVRWTEAWGDLSIGPRNLAQEACDPVVWDDAIVTETTWTAGGLCTRNGRFHWLIGRSERHGDRALVLFYTANPDFLAFEDAWVDFAGTTATLQGGATPMTPLDPIELRRSIRSAASEAHRSISPLPGGRVLSKAVIPRLEPLWALRAAAKVPPARLDGSEEPAAPTSPASPR
jgi:hypothetical protein